MGGNIRQVIREIERNDKMRTEQEIREKLEWLIKALDEEENQTTFQQCKIYAQIDLIRWLGVQR